MTEKNCANCRHSEMVAPQPPQIARSRVCVFLPPQIISMPTPGGVQIASGFPPVADTMCCHQWAAKVDADAKGSDKDKVIALS